MISPSTYLPRLKDGVSRSKKWLTFGFKGLWKYNDPPVNCNYLETSAIYGAIPLKNMVLVFNVVYTWCLIMCHFAGITDNNSNNMV